MVLQTKLVNTNNLDELLHQFIDLRKENLSKNTEKIVKGIVKALEDESDNGKHKSSFKSLFVGLFTHLIENKDVDLDVLEDVCQCYEKSSVERTEDEPYWADVVTDLILSLFPTASTYVVKHLMNGYRSITALVTQESINVIVENLCRTRNQEDEEEDSDDDLDVDDDDEADDEEVDDDDEEDADDDEEEGVEDEEEPSELEKFRAKLSSILGPDVDDDGEHGADDEEMLKLDEALSEAFKEKLGSSKKERVKELKLSDDFKCRVLTVYMTILKRRQIPATFVLPVIPIIINLTKSNSALAEKAVSTLGEISSIPVAKIDVKGIDLGFTGILNVVVRESFEVCCNPKSEKRQQIMAQVIIWTTKLAKAHNWSIPEFADGLVTYFRKSVSKSQKFNHSFFEGLVERDESVATILQESLIESIFDDSIKLLNRAPVCQILNLALKRGMKIGNPNELLEKCSNEVTNMLSGEGKVNVLILAGLVSLIDTLKTHKNYGIQVHEDLIQSLKSLDKKTRLKMPKSGQNAVKSILKGTIQESNGMKVDDKKKEKVKVKKSENGKKRKSVPISKGDDKLKKKKKLIKK